MEDTDIDLALEKAIIDLKNLMNFREIFCV